MANFSSSSYNEPIVALITFSLPYFLIACFDENITEEVVTEIAKLKPFFAIFKEGNNV